MRLVSGCGFVHFSGHGNPASWSTHPPKNESAWIDGLTVKHMSQLVNNEKQPIVIVGGCHNAQFNTSLTNIIKGVLEDGLKYFQYKKQPIGEFWYIEWIPECWAWAMETQTKGGAIAVIANSGLGYGEPGAEYINKPGSTHGMVILQSISRWKAKPRRNTCNKSCILYE